MIDDGESDPYNLARFVVAQNVVYEQVLSELQNGCKRSHWMWFVFPQIRGLGHSPLAAKFAISSLAEAKAYLAHSVLGPRLRECTQLVNILEGLSIEEIFYYPDDLKFHSSMTLFIHATDDNRIFTEALNKYFSGKHDALTMQRI